MNFLKNLLMSVLLVFAPVHAALLTVLVLVACDLVLGIMAARKRGESITSAGFRRTVVKLFVYEVAIMLGFLCETYLSGSLVPMTKIVAGFVGLTEMKSLMENLNEVSGGSLLKGLLEKLNSDNLQK